MKISIKAVLAIMTGISFSYTHQTYLTVTQSLVVVIITSVSTHIISVDFLGISTEVLFVDFPWFRIFPMSRFSLAKVVNATIA